MIEPYPLPFNWSYVSAFGDNSDIGCLTTITFKENDSLKAHIKMGELSQALLKTWEKFRDYLKC